MMHHIAAYGENREEMFFLIAGDDVEVTIHMEAQNYERAQSRNLIAQIPGREKTDEVRYISVNVKKI